MVLSSSDRDDLVRRVANTLARTAVRPAVIRDAVDRTLGALPDVRLPSPHDRAATRTHAESEAPPVHVTAIVSAASRPDLASRLRQHLSQAGVSIGQLATAHEGRHTVVVLRLERERASTLRAAAETLGATCTWREESQ